LARVPSAAILARRFGGGELRRGEAAPWAYAKSKMNLTPAVRLCRTAHRRLLSRNLPIAAKGHARAQRA
jgi:hypothetical protein